MTVRVEGLNQTLLPATQVTTDRRRRSSRTATTNTPAAARPPPVRSSSPPPAAGAGNGSKASTATPSKRSSARAHAFEPAAAANYFWSFWLDNKAASTGICEGELQAGESILFFPECFSETGACPAPPDPLGISAPAVAQRGAPIDVTVTSYDNVSGAASPAVGAAVTGGGAGATTDAAGHATLAIPQAGNVQLQVTAPGVRAYGDDRVRARRQRRHVRHDEPRPAELDRAAPGGAAPAAYKGPYAVVAQATGVQDGHVYPRGRGPKVLAARSLRTRASPRSA